MITIILIVIGVIAIFVAYTVGRVSAIPDWCCPPCQQPCNFPYTYCDCPKCRGFNHISETAVKIREEQAYQRGKYEGILETKSDIRFTRFMQMSEKEKFLKRFNECVKPIEELRGDLESGKF